MKITLKDKECLYWNAAQKIEEKLNKSKYELVIAIVSGNEIRFALKKIEMYENAKRIIVDELQRINAEIEKEEANRVSPERCMNNVYNHGECKIFSIAACTKCDFFEDVRKFK